MKGMQMVKQGIRSPEEFLEILRQKIKLQWVWAFWGTVLPGLLVHLYRMANYVMVDDSPYFTFSEQNTSYLGRWLLQWAGAISSYMELPALNAWLSLMYLGVFSVLFVELLQVRTPVMCGVMGACMAVLPAFTTTLLFAYAADPYMLALVLAGAAVLAVCRLSGWKGVAAGAVLLCLSMAIYQAYLDVAVLLCLLMCFSASLRNGPREALPAAGRMALMGAGGVLLYMGSAKLALYLQGMSASEYGGFSSMGDMNLAESLRVIKELYFGSAHIFMNKLFYATSLPWQLLGWGILGLMGLLAAALILQSGRERGLAGAASVIGHWVAAGVWLVLLPAGATALAILQPGSFPYNSLNGFANGLFVLIPLVFVDWLRPSRATPVQLTRWLTLGAVILMGWHFALIANQSVRLLRVVQERDMANANRILARMELQEGYTIHMKVFFGGTGVEVASSTPLMQYGDRLSHNIRGLHTDSLIFGDNAYHVFMNDNFGTAFSYVSAEEKEMILQSEEYAAMPQWPAEGCVRMIGDVLVVRLYE